MKGIIFFIGMWLYLILLAVIYPFRSEQIKKVYDKVKKRNIFRGGAK